MKRIFSVLLIAACCMFVAMPAQAQLFKWGVKGGVNMAKLDLEGLKAENTTGFFIGPMAEITIPIVGLGVDAALLYSQRGGDYWKQQGLEIPVNLKYTIGLGSTLGVFVAAGPDFFFNFKDIDWGDVEVTKKSAQVGLNIGAGLKLIKHLQLGVNYQIPLSKTFGVVGSNEADAKTKTWQISLAYMF